MAGGAPASSGIRCRAVHPLAVAPLAVPSSLLLNHGLASSWKRTAGGIHHICLEVDDVRESMAHVSSYARLLSDEPKIGAHGNPVVFLHPKDCDGVLTELEQAG